MAECVVRHAREQDSAEIARLATQLGYPATEDELRRRLQRLLASTENIVFVAESSEAMLTGWIHAFLSQLLESDYRVEIGGLVVDKSVHRQGIGRELMRHVEAWAVERGVAQIVVRCRTARIEAHRFYESLGYRTAKTQSVFRKRFTAKAGSPTLHSS
jgi:GNAT superfamily N-acetyltransferase